MGRIKYKVFFCSFCLDRNSDQLNSDNSFDQNIDVSHLATPHVSSVLSLTVGSSNSTPVGDSSSEDNNHDYKNLAKASGSNSSETQHKQYSSKKTEQKEPFNCDRSNSSLFQQQDNNNNIDQPRSSPTNSTPSPVNIYESQPAQSAQNQLLPSQQPQRINHQPAQNHHQQAAALEPVEVQQVKGTTTKLSYDIISVREPLAKILAERQQTQKTQLQQRQILGDHEYIEVYGDRGSSCFYEEIAGSTTSSATYDQIGMSSNHNYQVLINAYAVANRSSQLTNNNNAEAPPQQSTLPVEDQEENLYAVTNTSDEVDCPKTNSIDPKPSTSYYSPSNRLGARNISPPPRSILEDRVNSISESIPVYSVINKATRRSNNVIRAVVDVPRPPQPPPKNLTKSHLPSTSAMQSHQDTSSSMNTQPSSNSMASPQVPTSSSYVTASTVLNEMVEKSSNQTRLPQPPPRFSKFTTYTPTNRPLPLPDNFDSSMLSNCLMNQDSNQDDDLESLNNGYELLTANFDDDQIDEGYEKIRESNRYSGGSVSSQFCPLQALDNGGYESVQPIYSSPSNALVEPNYEAIGPATASELAAAATARLTAAAAVIEYLKQE